MKHDPYLAEDVLDCAPPYAPMLMPKQELYRRSWLSQLRDWLITLVPRKSG